jgi:hypothetical protein
MWVTVTIDSVFRFAIGEGGFAIKADGSAIGVVGFASKAGVRFSSRNQVAFRATEKLICPSGRIYILLILLLRLRPP